MTTERNCLAVFTIALLAAVAIVHPAPPAPRPARRGHGHCHSTHGRFAFPPLVPSDEHACGVGR